MRCAFCSTPCVKRATKWRCPSCDLYAAAIDAQQAAANSIARSRSPKAKYAFLNEYGVFAWVGDVLMQLGSPEEAAPFKALTQAAIRVTAFMDEEPISGSTDEPEVHP
jgi:hypothetical protein